MQVGGLLLFESLGRSDKEDESRLRLSSFGMGRRRECCDLQEGSGTCISCRHVQELEAMTSRLFQEDTRRNKTVSIDSIFVG